MSCIGLVALAMSRGAYKRARQGQGRPLYGLDREPQAHCGEPWTLSNSRRLPRVQLTELPQGGHRLWTLLNISRNPSCRFGGPGSRRGPRGGCAFGKYPVGSRRPCWPRGALDSALKLKPLRDAGDVCSHPFLVTMGYCLFSTALALGRGEMSGMSLVYASASISIQCSSNAPSLAGLAK